MGIREKGYHKWQGEIKSSAVTWLPISINGVKNAFKRKYAKAFFSFTAMHFLFFLALVYIVTKPELRMFQEVIRIVFRNDATFFYHYFTNGFIIFMIMIMCIFIFAELISGDLKFNAFPLYFSRPLDRKDYILGKFSIIMFYLLLFTLVPAVLLLVFKFIFSGQVSLDLHLLFGLIAVPLLVSAFFAAVTLMVSSFSANGRYVKIIIFLVFIFSNSIAEILIAIFKRTYFNLFSVNKNIEQMAAYIFNTRPTFSVPGWMSLAIVVGLITFSFFVLFRKIAKSEAQIEVGG